MLGKAGTLPADELVVDLEDAVPGSRKEEARGLVAAALGSPGLGDLAPAVRVNAPRSPWCHRDVEALGALDTLGTIVVPKVDGGGDLAFIDRLLSGIEAAAGREAPLRVQALIESAAGLANAVEIAGACERLDALILGYADLAASLGRGSGGDLHSWRAAQHQVLVAARTFGVQAIDGPYFDLSNEEGLRGSASHAAELGFDGKWAIHPKQLGAINEMFTPQRSEVERARAVIDALRRAESESGAGAVLLDGEMIDEAMAAAARRILASAGEPV